MKRHLQHGRETPHPTCENCAHTIRNKGRQDLVVCIPHLKTMPANNTTVCELHALRHRSA